MNRPLEVFWVAMFKDEPLYLVAGPFVNSELAEEALSTMEQPGGRCHLKVVKSMVEVEEV